MQTVPRQNSKSTETIKKLLRVALDPAAHIGESENAAMKLVTISRRDTISYCVLAHAIAADHQLLPPTPKARPRPYECDIVMEFGKHAGLDLSEIARRFPAYLLWMSAEIENEELRESAQIVLEWYAEIKRTVGGAR